MRKPLHKILMYLLQRALIVYSLLISKTCKLELKISEPCLQILRKASANETTLFCCTWHGRLAVFPAIYNHLGLTFKVVLSRHKDGEVISKVLDYYGHSAIRGSSRKGAVSAMRNLIEAMRVGGILGVTPDGPKGPKHKLKGAILSVAQKYKLPIVHVCFSASRSVTLSSWDGFMLPIPFLSTIYVNFSEPTMLDDLPQPPDEALERAMNAQMKELDKLANINEAL